MEGDVFKVGSMQKCRRFSDPRLRRRERLRDAANSNNNNSTIERFPSPRGISSRQSSAGDAFPVVGMLPPRKILYNYETDDDDLGCAELRERIRDEVAEGRKESAPTGRNSRHKADEEFREQGMSSEEKLHSTSIDYNSVRMIKQGYEDDLQESPRDTETPKYRNPSTKCLLVKTSPAHNGSSSSAGPAELVQCRYCSRSYAFERLPKHESICQKIKTRAVFNSRRQRTGDFDKFHTDRLEKRDVAKEKPPPAHHKSKFKNATPSVSGKKGDEVRQLYTQQISETEPAKRLGNEVKAAEMKSRKSENEEETPHNNTDYSCRMKKDSSDRGEKDCVDYDYVYDEPSDCYSSQAIVCSSIEFDKREVEIRKKLLQAVNDLEELMSQRQRCRQAKRNNRVLRQNSVVGENSILRAAQPERTTRSPMISAGGGEEEVIRSQLADNRKELMSNNCNRTKSLQGKTMANSRPSRDRSKPRPNPTQSRLVNEDLQKYVDCPYCSRSFRPSAADRHISWCEGKHR